MAENILVWTYETPIVKAGSQPPEEHTIKRIFGIETVDGDFFQSHYLYLDDLAESNPGLTAVDLEWPDDKAYRLAEFFDQHHTRPQEEGRPWNCQSLVAAVMGWEIHWNAHGEPYDLEARKQVTRLETGLAYGLTERVRPVVHHSVLGTANPDQVMSAWGFRGELLITPTDLTQQIYGQRILQHSIRPFTSRADKWWAETSGFRFTKLPESADPRKRGGIPSS